MITVKIEYKGACSNTRVYTDDQWNLAENDFKDFQKRKSMSESEITPKVSWSFTPGYPQHRLYYKGCGCLIPGNNHQQAFPKGFKGDARELSIGIDQG